MQSDDKRRFTADEDALAAMLAELGADPPRPSAALMGRVLADAERWRPRRPAERLRAALALLGGWPALGAMSASALAGVWIGLAGASLPGVASIAGVANGSDGAEALIVPYEELALADAAATEGGSRP